MEKKNQKALELIEKKYVNKKKVIESQKEQDLLQININCRKMAMEY